MGQTPPNGKGKTNVSHCLPHNFSYSPFFAILITYQHVPIPTRKVLCRKGCCTVTWCPLEISWATTIHKFQGFEAGFDESDMFNHLIVDPGDMAWEQRCPGALYVSLSRAKTMGTFTSDTSFPRDSAIYWVGCRISSTRIKEGHLRKNKKKGGPKLKCTYKTPNKRYSVI